MRRILLGLLFVLALLACGEPGVSGSPPPRAGDPSSVDLPTEGDRNEYVPPPSNDISTPNSFRLKDVEDAEPSKVYSATATLTGFLGETFVSAEGASDIEL